MDEKTVKEKKAKAVVKTKVKIKPKAKVKAKTKTASSTRGVEKTLVIVESPAKAATIEKYLGSSYKVRASMGHLIDLPKSRMAVNVDSNFEPEYITVRGRASVLKELLGDAKKSRRVFLASDNDREGEAIAWHLNNAILKKKPGLPVARIVFNEITPKAIKDAVANPITIDQAMVNAQKARRVLDRLVGYNLSPLLWKKVKNGLSAGRVQSCTLKLICDREAEVEVFIPEEFWTLACNFAPMDRNGLPVKKTFRAELASFKGEKPLLRKEKDVKELVASIENESFSCVEIRKTEKSIKPRAPFTTSLLQQTSANRLGWTSRKTMQVAQMLYEGVNIGHGRVGLITYMRTDSTRVSEVALGEVRAFIEKEYPSCLPPAPVRYASGKSSQDAHEAIRPTYVTHTPASIERHLSRDEFRLYSIIWERFVGSQMTPAVTQTVSADIRGGEAVFRVSGTKTVEAGFYRALTILLPKEERAAFPAISEGDALFPKEFLRDRHWTQGPSRFTDASIIKILEEKGIGRPSTYAPTISLLLDRFYVTRKEKQLVPTILGRKINDMLSENFPDIVDAGFTADLETKLDEVADDKLSWPKMIGDFYMPFKVHVDDVERSLESTKGSLDEPTDLVCEKCGRPIVKKLGKFGYFLACTGFPECRNSKSVPLAKCPKCGGDIVARKKKGRGREFYGCTNYPECDFLTHDKPLPDQYCPKCGQFLVEKRSKAGVHKACINPACDYLHDDDDEPGAPSEPSLPDEQAERDE
jgi:DNA topoisomerase-1